MLLLVLLVMFMFVLMVMSIFATFWVHNCYFYREYKYRVKSVKLKSVKIKSIYTQCDVIPRNQEIIHNVRNEIVGINVSS